MSNENGMKKRVNQILILLIHAILICGYSAARAEVRLLQSSENGCTIEYTPSSLELVPVMMNGKQYQRIHFTLASPPEKPGIPMLPCRVLVVGIPIGCRVSVNSQDWTFTEQAGIRIQPVPELQDVGGLPAHSFREGPAYQTAGFTPENPFIVENASISGDRHLVRIFVYPVQFDPTRNRIRMYSHIVLRVDFTGIPSHTGGSAGPEKTDAVFRNTVINHAQAEQWRMPHPMRMGKRLLRPQAGQRIKIPVSQTGIYRLTGRDLNEAGISIGTIETGTVKIFNNGGRELPRDLSIPRPDSLIENPILLFGMDDNRFDEDDFILFYGTGVNGWEYSPSTNRYEHYKHLYTLRNQYWLVFNDGVPGKRVPSVPPQSPDGAQILDRFTDRLVEEREITNTQNAGIHWYGPSFDNDKTLESFDVLLQDYPGGDLSFRFRFVGASSGSHTFSARLNDQSFLTTSFFGTSSHQQTGTLPSGGQSGRNTLSLQYTGSGLASQAYLDWFEIEYTRSLTPQSGRLNFFSPLPEGTYDFRLAGFDSAPTVLDVTRPDEIRRLECRSMSGVWAFVDAVANDEPKRYVAAQESGFLTVSGIETDDFADLRNIDTGADLIIITHPEFEDQAARLEAHREQHDSLSVLVVDIQDVYDEFGWGLEDPTSIRDFVRFAHMNWPVRPSYLLLFGDGDYDYRNILPYESENRIPPFEFDGLTESGSRASDDWYTYVSGNDSRMDLAVGRLPVQTHDEAKSTVDKIIAYETNPTLNDWRSIITMVGDDEKAQHGDENEITHTRATERIAENVMPPLFNLRKIYLSEYPEVITIEGRRKPQAAADLVDQINQGTLLVNFVGHGNENLWAHERVFVQTRDMERLQNTGRLPFFYAATCAFAHFDDPLEQSFAEDLMNAEGIGGIAVIGASRFCSAAPNEALNEAFMNAFFTTSGVTERIGDALRAAKLMLTSTTNNEMYHVIGDPAMRLGMPRYRAVFTSVTPDTFKALSVVQIQGKVQKDGVDWPEFQGKAFVSAYDSQKDVVYTTQYGTRLPYVLPGNALFRGETPIDQGRFDISFIVPKDITYGGHTGRLHCYLTDELTDGAGYSDNIEVGGSAVLADSDGPEITLFFLGQDDFVTGGMVSEDPDLVAVIEDGLSGINITGEIGHKIMLTIDEESKLDLTDHFQYDQGSYLKGQLVYRLSDIEEGEHALHLKAWDNANNSSTQSLIFRIVLESELRLEEVLNYPNPFSTSTHFTFKLSQDAAVEIRIYTVDGRLINTIDYSWGTPGFNMIPWDGRDDVGDALANGVYLYKITAKAESEGKTLKKEVIGRLMVMHR